MKSLLKGVSQALFAIAALLLFVGGRAIHEFTRADRVLGEVAGIGLAFVFGILGMIAKNSADNLNDEDSETQ